MNGKSYHGLTCDTLAHVLCASICKVSYPPLGCECCIYTHWSGYLGFSYLGVFFFSIHSLKSLPHVRVDKQCGLRSILFAQEAPKTFQQITRIILDV